LGRQGIADDDGLIKVFLALLSRLKGNYYYYSFKNSEENPAFLAYLRICCEKLKTIQTLQSSVPLFREEVYAK
jgi:hypothetical protein